MKEPEPTPKRQPARASAKSSWLLQGLGWRKQAWLERVRRARKTVELAICQAVGFSEPEAKLIEESQNYWNGPSDRSLTQNSHWRGAGIFADDSRWLALGDGHLRLYREFARAVGRNDPPKRVAEWGCGGGINAVHFARAADKFYGIDISAASLEECARQMKLAGLETVTL